jgi:hypothetical protein
LSNRNDRVNWVGTADAGCRQPRTRRGDSLIDLQAYAERSLMAWVFGTLLGLD